MRVNGWPSVDWILAFSNRENRSKSGPESVAAGVTTCVGLFTWQALVALRRDPYLRCFDQNLLVRGKARLQAVVAVVRKLLHALFALFRTNQPYDGSKLCAVSPTDNATAVCA